MNRFPRLVLSGSILLLMSATTLSCGGDDNNPMNPGGGGGTPADVIITIPSGSISAGSMAFQPNPADVKVGQTVSWKNNDGTTHTATGSGFNVAISGNSTSAPITISGATGNRAYSCTVAGHTMSGTLNVTP